MFRAEHGRAVAVLARSFGDLDIAEEAAAEAFAAAVERWPADGVPPNPGGWLTTTATRKALVVPGWPNGTPAITTTSARHNWPSTTSRSSLGSVLTMPMRLTSAPASRAAAASA